MTLLDFGLVGPTSGGAVPCLKAVYEGVKEFASANNLYLHMTNLTRTLLSWPTHADFPTGLLDIC